MMSDFNITDSRYLTALQVSELLNLPKATVYELARTRRIDGVIRIGRTIRFDEHKLLKWLDEGGSQ